MLQLKYLLGIFILLILSCNSKNFDSKNTVYSTNKDIEFHNRAISFLDSLKYLNFYNESKWKLYLKYCDKILVKDSDKKYLNRPRYFGEANIILFSANIKQDSLLSILFNAVIDDSIYVLNDFQFVDTSSKWHLNLWHYYNIIDNRFYGLGYDQGIAIDSTELNSYCNEMPQCDKSKFILLNKAILNRWFIEQAIERKFIQ